MSKAQQRQAGFKDRRCSLDSFGLKDEALLLLLALLESERIAKLSEEALK
jgi:hypothetical protein